MSFCSVGGPAIQDSPQEDTNIKPSAPKVQAQHYSPASTFDHIMKLKSYRKIKDDEGQVWIVKEAIKPDIEELYDVCRDANKYDAEQVIPNSSDKKQDPLYKHLEPIFKDTRSIVWVIESAQPTPEFSAYAVRIFKKMDETKDMFEEEGYLWVNKALGLDENSKTPHWQISSLDCFIRPAARSKSLESITLRFAFQRMLIQQSEARPILVSHHLDPSIQKLHRFAEVDDWHWVRGDQLLDNKEKLETEKWLVRRYNFPISDETLVE